MRYTCIEREGEGWHFSKKYLSLLWEALKSTCFYCGTASIYYIIKTKSLFLIRKLGFLIIANRSDVSKLVTLRLDSQPVSVLCHMGDFGCGDGGWTPVMKIDGNKVWVFFILFSFNQKIAKSIWPTCQSASIMTLSLNDEKPAPSESIWN